MMKRIHILGIVLATLLAAQAEKTIPIDIGVPLKDAAVCRGPSGEFYLTGTIGSPCRVSSVECRVEEISEPTPACPERFGDTPKQVRGSSSRHSAPDTGYDFHNNRGVRVWKSTDLKTWEDLGYVWDLWKDPSNNAHGHDGSAWQTELYPVPGIAPGERARGMTAPKLAFDGERFWITFSMNGYAAGAMPGENEVTGIYKDTKLIVEAGAAPTDKSDASLFVDTNPSTSSGRSETRYLLWGGGCLAQLKSVEDLEHVKMNRVGIEEPRHYLPALIEGYPGDDGLPDRGAPYGPILFHDGRQYQFIFTATTLRDNGIHEDSYICSADNLLGPYSKPKFFILDSGRCSVFNVKDGKRLVAYSTPDHQPVLAAYPSSLPSYAQRASEGKPDMRVEIATQLPPPLPKQRPDDVPQLLETITPCLDHPLRDAALCFGPDGAAYLTGTEASWKAEGRGQKAEVLSQTELDWAHNKGIRLWKSRDLENWEDLGYVWEIGKNGSDWHKQVHLDLTCGATPRIGRAVTAPELHYLKGTFWIVYSMNGSGIGLMKSASGKAEGPYEDLGKLVAHGRDPSLFDDGNTIYLVWGQGFYAPMKDDMSGLAGPVKTLFTQVAWYPRYLRRMENMGLWGSQLNKQGDWYVWTFTTRSGRCGINAIDTAVSWSKSLEGPWGEPCLMLANGGQSTMVQKEDPTSPSGLRGAGATWLATVSGEDEYSECPFQPAITPIVSNGQLGKPLGLKPYRETDVFTQWNAVNSYEATALDLYMGHPDFIPYHLRDVCIVNDKGTFYCTGSFWGEDELRRDAVIFQSKDLVHWEKMPPIYSYADLKRDGMIAEKDIPAFDELIEADREGSNWRKKIQIGEQKIWILDGNYYFNMQGFCTPGGHFLLKSQSGKIDGPYKAIQEIIGVADLMQDTDGAVIFNGSGVSNRRFKNVEQFESTHKSQFRKVPETYEIEHEEPWLQNICFSEDCEPGLMIIEGKYVTWSTDWTGCYDAIYRYGDAWNSVYRGRMRILPYGGNGRFYQDHEGTWFYAYFMNSNDYAKRSQNHVKMNMYPLYTGFENGELIIEPKALRANRMRLEQMGALWQGRR